MKWHLLIAVILGIALGISLHNLPSLPSEQVPPPSGSTSSVPRENASTSLDQTDFLPEFTDDQISSSKSGAIRRAKTALWVLSASGEELKLHWQTLLDQEEPSRTELKSFMAIWVRRDFQTAFDTVRGRPHESIFHAVYAEVDRENALALAKESGPNSYASALRTIAHTDPDFAMESLDQLPDNRQSGVALGIIHGLFKRDPKAAIDYADGWGMRMPDLVSLWGSKDPKGAFSYLLAKKSNHSYSFLRTAFKADPEHAKAQIDSMPTGRLKADMMRNYTKLVAESDPQKAIELAESQAHSMKINSLIGIGEVTAATQPQVAFEAFARIAKERKDGEQFYGISWSANWVSQLVRDEPEKMLAFARKYEPESEQYFLRAFSMVSSARPRSWLESLPRNEESELLASVWIQQNSHPTGADLRANLELATGFQTAKLRTQTMNSVVEKWHKINPEELQEFLASPSSSPQHHEIYNTLTEPATK